MKTGTTSEKYNLAVYTKNFKNMHAPIQVTQYLVICLLLIIKEFNKDLVRRIYVKCWLYHQKAGMSLSVQ